MSRRVRIGNGCGFWGDNVDAPVLLAEKGQPDYLTLEYLAELTMSILAQQRQRDAKAGFATDFYEVVGLTHFQQVIPDHAYGRFFSVFLIALSAGGLVGALAGPVLEQQFGVSGSLAALAAPAVALAVLLAWMTRAWQSREGSDLGPRLSASGSEEQ